jgi:hypothetical protein
VKAAAMASPAEDYRILKSQPTGRLALTERDSQA